MTTQPDNIQLYQKSAVLNSTFSWSSVNYREIENNSAAITLLQNGMILSCNKASAELLGCAPNRLVWQHISRLLPQLSDISLILDEKINPYLNFLSVIGHRFEVIGMNGMRFSSELIFSVLDEFDRRCLKITLQSVRQGQVTI